APYTFFWSDGQTGQSATNLKAGKDYNVVVTDANGCTTSMKFDIYDPLYGEILASSQCIDDKKYDGLRISYFDAVNVRGGTGRYTYEWNFDEDASPTGSGAGRYTVKYNFAGLKNISL